jgi:type I restriction enzyme M protein
MKTMSELKMKQKETYRQSSPSHGKVKEQQVLFTEESLLPNNLPRFNELRPATNLSSIFDECHNYIYANEGMLKDKIFHEMVKLLVMKLHDEQDSTRNEMQFGVTSSEYREILKNNPSVFNQRLGKLYDTVRSKYSSLFPDESLKLKPLTLAYIVGRLQYISLIRTPGDVKGEAFQAFVYRHQRGDRSEFFTPHPVVRLAVEMIAPKPNEIIIDPACGSGGFLIQTISYVCRHNPDIEKSAYVRKHICGIEFNPDVALSAMIRLAFEGGIGAEIICANALVKNEQLNNAFDIVLTNPPFGSKGKIEEQRILKSYILARRWNRTGNDIWEATRNVLAGQSPEILFIELCLKLLRPSGRMAIVLPDGLLQNISNNHIRFWIRSQAKVLGVVSIPQEAFVPYGTGIKTSLLLLQKLPATADRVFMARIQKIGYDVKGQPVYKRDDNGRFFKKSSGMHVVDDDIDDIAVAYSKFRESNLEPECESIYFVPEKMLNVRLDVEHYHPEDRKLLEHLQASGAKSLGEIAHILNETDDFRQASNGDIRYIAISDVDARTMQVVSQQVIKAHDAPSRAKYRLQKNDIITAISGASTGTTRHATALITDDEEGAICSNGFAVLRTIRGIDPFFLLAYMRTEFFLRQVRRLMTGHAIPAISVEDLSKVLVPIPDIESQKKISDGIVAIFDMRKESLKNGLRVIAETESIISKLSKK